MKYQKSIIILLLLTFSMFSFLGTTAKSTAITIQSIEPVTSPVIESISSLPIEVDEYLLFADSQKEFEQFLSLNPKKVYPSLRAVIVDLGEEYELFKFQIPDRIFPTSLLDTIRPIIDPPTSSSLSLDNGYEDADIMDVARLWDAGYSGNDTVVAIFDNGILETHSGLTGQVVQSVNFNVDITGTVNPICRTHGTPVSGTVVSTGKLSNGTIDPELRGMAYSGKVIGVNLGCAGDNNEYVRGDILGAFDWILANNASIDVINTSWGGGSNAIFYPIVERLAEENVILVGSAGNSGPDPSTVGGPGSSPEAISVGAIDYGSKVVGFSSRGPSAGNQFKPDLMAPGSGVMTALSPSGYGRISGTSFSSPLTAGAIATIISALKANGVPYNPGVIKAALMNNGSMIGTDELTVGHGVVQAYKAYQNIMNSPKGADNVSQMLDMSPRYGSLPLPLYRNIPRGIETNIPFTLIASHLADVTVGITGNLADIMSFNQSLIDPARYSLFTYLSVNTTDVAFGTYSGEVVATLGSKTVSATYTIVVDREVKGKILMDLRHTAWDSTGADIIGGSNTGEFINIAFSKGIWVDEYHDIITPELLSSYDTIWLPDPLDIDYSDPNDTSAARAEDFLQSEIDAIVAFVNSGGSLFTDFNGYGDDPDSVDNIGTDPFKLNQLISNFGINASTSPITYPGGEFAVPLNNQSSPVGAAEYISHFGNYLDIFDDARAVASYGSSISTAIWDPVDKGRVLVTSTNFWMDNGGAGGGYAAGQGDVIFVNNVLDWLVSDIQVKLLASQINSTTIYGKYQIIENGIPVSSSPAVQLLDFAGVSASNISPSSLGNGIFEFTYQIVDDGVYQLQVAYGDEYAVWSTIKDTTAPVITPLASNPNKTAYDMSNLFLKFDVFELVSSLGRNSFSITLDDVVPNSSDYLLTYISSSKEMRLLLQKTLWTETASHIYNLVITVEDEFGNTSSILFQFTFDDTVFPRLGQTTTSGETGVTTSAPPATTSTTEDPTPINLFFVLLGLIGIPVLYRRRK